MRPKQEVLANYIGLKAIKRGGVGSQGGLLKHIHTHTHIQRRKKESHEGRNEKYGRAVIQRFSNLKMINIQPTFRRHQPF